MAKSVIDFEPDQIKALFEADPAAKQWLEGERKYERAVATKPPSAGWGMGQVWDGSKWVAPPSPERTHIYQNVTKLPWWFRLSESRKPDQRIGPGYMDRWHVIPRNRFFNIYLHRFLQSDDDRALHDHPWCNFSYLLAGEYVEHTIAAGGVNRRQLYKAGDWKFRRPKYAHRVELISGECWSLFITGPRIRSWGFHCPKGWVDWKRFTDPTDTGKIGRGCD